MTQATTPANGETPGSPDLDSLANGQPVEMDGIHVAAATLQEPNVDLLAAVAREIGMDRFDGLLQETLAIEAADGMMLGDGSRRRTPGGVFFFLARKAMTGEQRQRVFPPPLHNLQQSAQTQEAPSLATALGLIRATGNIPPEKKGKATVKTTVIGRVKQIKSMGEFVLAVVTPRGPEPMPKGLPPVPDPGATSIAVFVVRNQWPRVEAALKADPKDALIAEGYLALDAKNQLTGLWALTCTTRNLQKTRYGVK